MPSTSKPFAALPPFFFLATGLATAGLIAGGRSPGDPPGDEPHPEERAAALVREGRHVFRHDTFGSEAFWGDQLRLHEAIAGARLGGVGPGLSPAAALDLGLKVDVRALPDELQRALAAGAVDLDDPAVTLELLRLRSVVGLGGRFDAAGRIEKIGIQCALCHSTVDDSFAPGIGERRDGWPNRDLDIGAIIAFAPDLSPFAGALGVGEPTVRRVLASWGPGRFDAHLLLDGKTERPDGETAAVLIPAAFGLGGVNLHTYTGWGSISHWNALVGVLEMQGQGTFRDDRLRDASKFPVAAANGFSHVRAETDRITGKLAALQLYQLALPVPRPPEGSFDAQAAGRGRALFEGTAGCADCHVPPIYTDPGWNMHPPEAIGIDDFQARRSPDGRYRTTPLAGLFTKTKGGFYHDGRFADLREVVEHYDGHFALGLGEPEKSDLVEFLKSL